MVHACEIHRVSLSLCHSANVLADSREQLRIHNLSLMFRNGNSTGVTQKSLYLLITYVVITGIEVRPKAEKGLLRRLAEFICY